jgi:hypothetical protein
MNNHFSHQALNLQGKKELVYTALSKHYFYFKSHISRYVLEQNKVPLNPFMLFDYFLLDTIDRDLVRDANNALVVRADQLWVFGPVSNGVLAEILLAKKMSKPLFYFKIEKSQVILPADEIELEEDVSQFRSLLF